MSLRRTHTRAVLGLALAATALTPAAASAAAGDLDPTFGTAGKRIVQGTEQPIDLFVQPDGKIVEVGGPNSLFSNQGFLVRRTLADGSPDKSFDGDGTAFATFPNAPDVTAVGAALQPDGAIVVGGVVGGGGVAVARFTSSGALDKTFDEGGADGDGRAVISTTGTGFSASDLVLQPGGKIALSGTQGNDADFAVMRLRSDGSVDSTTFDLGDFSDHNEFATAATQGPDGTMTVVGTTDGTSSTITGVVRYKSDGKLDGSLAGTGKATTAAIERPLAVVVQPDGKTLVTGEAGSTRRKTVVARLTKSGEPDPTFGTGGKVELVDADREDIPSSIALQPDGKVLVSGALGGTVENATFEVFVARFDDAGRPDPSYGSGGRAAFSLGEVTLGGPIVVQPDGKVVMAAYGITTSIIPRPLMARLLPDPAPASPGGGGEQPSTQQTEQPTQPQQGGTTTNPADTIKPGLAGLRVVATRRGREVRFKLSEAAIVRFTLERVPRKGRVKPVRGSFSLPAAAGTNRIDIAARSIVRRLPAGRYRLVATPTDAAGNRGTARRAAFTVKRKKK